MPRGKKEAQEATTELITVPQQPPSKVYLGWDIGIKNLAFCLITPATATTSNAI